MQIVRKMTNNIKKTVRHFHDEFGVKDVTLENLCAAIKKQGYIIVEYNNIFNDDNVASLIDALGLEQLCERSKGFTYADSKRRLVFLHEDLSEDEKLMVLAHEEGHIYCEHMNSSPIIGRDVQEEHEANEFAHYLLNPSMSVKVKRSLKQHKKAVCVSVIGLILAVSLAVTLGYVSREKRYYGEYYITETGSKYHEKDCAFVRNKTNVHRMTVEEYESGDYEPCKVCQP